MCGMARLLLIENVENEGVAFDDGFQAWPQDIRQRTVPCLTIYQLDQGGATIES